MILYDLLNLWYKKKFYHFKELLLKENFLDEKIFDHNEITYRLWMKSFTDDSATLRSNHTHHDSNEYCFAPQSGISLIENIIKNDNKQTCWLHTLEKTSLFVNVFRQKYYAYCDFTYGFDPTNPCFKDLEKFDGNFRATPQTWMFLSKEKSFIEILQRGKINSLITSSYEPDFPKKEFEKYTRINDNMFNWKTGECFFTCKKNNKHTFPFYIIRDGLYGNLLNTCEKNFYSSDDFFELDFSPCECGLKWPKVAKFESHTKMTKLKKISLEPLKGQYSIFQIVENSENHVFYCLTEINNKVPKEDLDYLNLHYGKGLLFPNKYFVVGIDKIPFFLTLDDNINYKKTAITKKIKLL